MEVKLLRGAAAAKAKKRFRLEPNDVQQMAVHVAQVARDKFGAVIPSLKFIYNEGIKSSAYLTPSTGEVTLNFAQLRTLRDIVFSIGHEACHTKQVQKFNSPIGMVFAYQAEVMVYGYHAAPMEKEADDFGFHFENSFSYKSRAFNTETESIFIHRKKHPRGRMKYAKGKGL